MTRDDEIRRAFHELSGLAADTAGPALRTATVPRPRGATVPPAPRRPRALVVGGLVAGLVAAVFVVAAPRPGGRPAVVVTNAPAGGPTSTGSAPDASDWRQETSARSTASTIPGSQVVLVRPTVTGRTLAVWFWATGTGTERPEPTCLRVEPPTGKPVRVPLAGVVLDTAEGGNYSGTMTFEDVPDGVVWLVYRCDGGYEGARLGVLG